MSRFTFSAHRPTLPPALRSILAVLQLLPTVDRGRTAILAVGTLLTTALPLLFTVVAGVLVGMVPAAIRGGLHSTAAHHAFLALLAAGGVIALQRTVGPLVAALAGGLGRRVDQYLQERTMRAVAAPGGISHLEDPLTLDLLQQAQGLGAQGSRPGNGVAALASLIPSWLGVIGSAAIIMTFRWWLGLAWIVLWPVLLYVLQREYIRVGAAASGEAAGLRRAAYYRDLALTPEAAKEVRLWGLSSWLGGRFERAWHDTMEPIWAARKPGRAVLWSASLVVVVAEAIAFTILVRAALGGEIGLTALAIYSRAIIDAGTFRAFDDANMELAYATAAVPSLIALEERIGAEAPQSIPGPSAVAPSAPVGIRFEGVSFAYPGSSRRVLSDLDLQIRPGESVAIVGANGAGKTTLVKLLCGLYEPSEGRITLDGVPDGAGLRGVRIAAVFQDFARFHLSARDNIAVGAPQCPPAPVALESAARRGGALAIIEALPQGWDTVLSRQYTGGVDLSGGQWQRIALARAFYAVEHGARVLVLDEPTANLDIRAEAELYDRSLSENAGVTTILISHRFSTVRRADRIVVLDGGHIVEDGFHHELMLRDGLYAAMFRLQAQAFVDDSTVPDMVSV